MGERRSIKNGTLARVPLENVLGEVLALPNQDTFSVGVDTCFILASPALRNTNDDMWIHWVRGVPVAGGGYRSGCEGGGSDVIPTAGGMIPCNVLLFSVKN